MLRAYSEILGYTTAVNTWTYFTVPAGYRAVVRDVATTTTSSAPGTARVSGHGRYLTQLTIPGTSGAARAEIYQVIYEGGWLGLHLSVAGMTVVVSGYLLADESGRGGPIMLPSIGLPPPGEEMADVP